MTTFRRQIVPLQPGEAQPRDLLIDLPEGYRLETDAEFRNRIIQSGAHRPTAADIREHGFEIDVHSLGPVEAIQIATGAALDDWAERFGAAPRDASAEFPAGGGPLLPDAAFRERILDRIRKVPS